MKFSKIKLNKNFFCEEFKLIKQFVFYLRLPLNWIWHFQSFSWDYEFSKPIVTNFALFLKISITKIYRFELILSAFAHALLLSYHQIIQLLLALQFPFTFVLPSQFFIKKLTLVLFKRPLQYYFRWYLVFGLQFYANLSLCGWYSIFI